MSRRSTTPARRKSPAPLGVSRRVVTLAALLALVVMAMKSLQQPATIDKLGRTFGLSAPPPPASFETTQTKGEATDQQHRQDAKEREWTPLVAASDSAWDTVKDNAPFRSEENAAWFQLLAAMKQRTLADLTATSLGEATYAQLRGQPQSYRGKVVTVRGTVLRAERKTAPANTAGIEHYDQLWLAPAGGGEWPILLYALDLPEGFPRGDQLREPVETPAAFFKIRSYSYGDGVGLAPVCVAPTIAWATPSATPASRSSSRPDFAWPSALGALLAAIALAGWVARRTRRPPRVGSLPVALAEPFDALDVYERLAAIANREQQEESI